MQSFLLVLSFCVVFTSAYQTFQNVIPNGDLVPHPCKPNYLWKGVGHLNVLGGGARNPFGQDFSRLGKTWSRELCEMDSDGDGKTNGEELGDPGCMWTPLGGPPSNKAQGHPGVCEPVDSLLCRAKNAAVKEDWEFCEQGEFKCDAVNAPGVKNFTIAIDARTKVPAQETTYMCQLVKLPDDEQYHIIGSKPAIDNQIVAHHIIVYGCDETALETISRYSSPQVCDSMAIYKACRYGVGGWTVGQDGYCDLPNVGTKFGMRVFNYALIEIHWNNPMEVPDYTDGSGLTIFYTPQLREYDAGSLTIGQESLAIPPNVDTHYQTGYCHADCTKDIEQPINIYSLNLHMHYLGRGGRVEHWRNGSLLQVLANEDAYSYDSPKEYMLDPPVVFQPGDELKMFCKFKSRSRDAVTYFGDGTSDEMCFAFLSYYPKIDFGHCVNYGPASSCSKPDQDPEEVIYNSLKKMGCDISSYEDVIGKVIKQAAELCGYEYPQCTQECREYLKTTYRMEPCLRNELRFMFEAFMRLEPVEDTEVYIRLLRVCDTDMVRANTVAMYYEIASGATLKTSLGLALTLLIGLITALNHL